MEQMFLAGFRKWDLVVKINYSEPKILFTTILLQWLQKVKTWAKATIHQSELTL